MRHPDLPPTQEITVPKDAVPHYTGAGWQMVPADELERRAALKAKAEAEAAAAEQAAENAAEAENAATEEAAEPEAADEPEQSEPADPPTRTSRSRAKPKTEEK